MKRTSRATRSKSVQTTDNFQNLAARVGLGAGSVNDASRYSFSPVSRNRVQMEQVYRSSWIAGRMYEALIKQIELIRLYQSNEGMTLMDAKDKFEAHQFSFAGLPDVLLQFGQQISGAIGIPLVRLFGQSPAGLNSTGESDTRYVKLKMSELLSCCARFAATSRFHIAVALGDRQTPAAPTTGLD